MDDRTYTIWGKTSDGFLISNIGKIRPRNIFNFQNNIEGFFKYKKCNNSIVEYFGQKTDDLSKTKRLLNTK